MSFQWLSGVDLVWAAGLITVLYLALLGWVMTRPPQMVLRGAPDRKAWRDLRRWILPLILIQIGLHWLFQ